MCRGGRSGRSRSQRDGRSTGSSDPRRSYEPRHGSEPAQPAHLRPGCFGAPIGRSPAHSDRRASSARGTTLRSRRVVERRRTTAGHPPGRGRGDEVFISVDVADDELGASACGSEEREGAVGDQCERLAPGRDVLGRRWAGAGQRDDVHVVAGRIAPGRRLPVRACGGGGPWPEAPGRPYRCWRPTRLHRLESRLRPARMHDERGRPNCDHQHGCGHEPTTRASARRRRQDRRS